MTPFDDPTLTGALPNGETFSFGAAPPAAAPPAMPAPASPVPAPAPAPAPLNGTLPNGETFNFGAPWPVGGMNSAYSSFWPEQPPARSTVVVAALVAPAKLEIECIASLK